MTEINDEGYTKKEFKDITNITNEMMDSFFTILEEKRYKIKDRGRESHQFAVDMSILMFVQDNILTLVIKGCLKLHDLAHGEEGRQRNRINMERIKDSLKKTWIDATGEEF